MSEWQPIETAPKDGTEIDLWYKPKRWFNGERVTNFSWVAKRHRFEAESWPCELKLSEATHWMPLPEPPK